LLNESCIMGPNLHGHGHEFHKFHKNGPEEPVDKWKILWNL